MLGVAGMRSAGHTPTAKAKRWMAWVGEQPCINCRAPACVHHCAGATARHNKVAIGDWWLLPLCHACHQGQNGIHQDRTRFMWMNSGPGVAPHPRKELEKALFHLLLVKAFVFADTDIMPSQEITNAIEDYHR